MTAADGAQFAYDGARRTFLRVKNTGETGATISVPFGALVDGQTVPAKTNQVAATTGDELMGPYGLDYKQSDGKIYLTTDVDVSVALLTLSNT